MNKRWTKNDIAKLSRLYPCNDSKTVAAKLGFRFTVAAIKTKARTLGLKNKLASRKWTHKELNQLKDLFPNNSTKKVAQILHRSTKAVSQKAAQLGLKKNETYLNSASCNRWQKGTKSGIHYRFKKGHATWNKGMKGLSYEGSKTTQFKQGQMPHNHKPVGSERIVDGYLEIKVAEPKKWKQWHRLEWEKVHGAIPKGYIVVFKDGNSNNRTIKNLELITRAENMKRNSVHNYPEDVKQTIQTLGALKRRINHAKKQIAGLEKPSV